MNGWVGEWVGEVGPFIETVHMGSKSFVQVPWQLLVFWGGGGFTWPGSYAGGWTS